MTIPTLLIDGYGFVFRAYHVQPSLTSVSGEPVGALYGFMSMLLKILTDFRPIKCAIVFDSGGKNFRHTLYPEYKAHRPPVPGDLKFQLPLVRDVAASMGFPILECAGVEADDIIASVATKLVSKGEEVVIISSDKDLMQLIEQNIRMYDPVRAKYIDAQNVKEKFGVGPEKVRDVLSLIGDASDNIPGAKGIGPKGAAELITQFGSIPTLLASVDEIKNDKKRETIQNSKEQIELSWSLVGLKYDIAVKDEDLSWKTPDRAILSNLMSKYGFKSLMPRAEKLFGMDLEVGFETKVIDLITQNEEIKDNAHLKKILDDALVEGQLAIFIDEGGAIYIAVSNRGYVIMAPSYQNTSSQGDLFSASYGTVDLQILCKIISDKSLKKITFDAKRLWHKISAYCKNIDNIQHSFEDIALMRYSVTAGVPQLQAQEFFNSHPITSFIQEYNKCLQEVYKNKALSLYLDIDLPVTKVLYDMECVGVSVDQSTLTVMSEKFDQEIKILEKRIHEIAGMEFNIASPKQLGEILFEKMGLPSSKISAKTKVYSTGAEALENLSEAGFEIGDLLLRWREITKLKNTYTDSLPKKINSITSRIHTHFVQNLTTTGRLSSQDPNLQNIPIRTKEGSLIRTAFVAREGCVLLSADYSQIELRLLAHVAEIEPLKLAFLKGEDIHGATAAQVFGISKDSVTTELRRKAKAINFGIIYGISAFGLAKQLQIGRKEALSIQERYFKEYPGVKKYMDDTKEFAKQNGYVRNMFGRKCILPLIKDNNFANRSFAERAAINAPLQGGNADIIKLAMIEIFKQFKTFELKSKLVLQVHDELVLEVPNDELEQVKDIVRKAMESVVHLTIPLTVEIICGNNWSKSLYNQ